MRNLFVPRRDVRRRAVRPSLEALEHRLAPAIDPTGSSSLVGSALVARLQDGVLSVLGTEGDDHISLSRSGDLIEVAGLDGGFRAADIRRIVVKAKGGHDVIDLRALGQDAGPTCIVFAGAGHDVIRGSDAAETLYGNAGSDFLQGGGSDDLVRGGAGDDTLDGGRGLDLVCGGRGRDMFLSNPDAVADHLRGGAGLDMVFPETGLQVSGRPVEDLVVSIEYDQRSELPGAPPTVDDPDEPIPVPPRPTPVGPSSVLPADAAQVARDSNDFAFSLYEYLDEQDDGNLFFSPYSISTALAMTYAGARGETAAQMATTLHFLLQDDRLHNAFGELIAQENGAGQERGYELAVANALWGQRDFAFEPEFLQLLNEHYGAGMHEMDFINMPGAARLEINAWVEQQTHDKIKNLLQQGTVTPDTRLVLTNAIYFKSAWANPFDETFTRKDDFFTGGATVVADMMHQTDGYSFYEDDDVQVLDMPYKGGDLSLIAVLPRQMVGLAEVEQSLNAGALDGWLGAMTRQQVEVELPKFQMTLSVGLKDALTDLGMPLAFSGDADFSGITNGAELHISDVVHKAFIDLNEEGTEAAAATAVIINVTSVFMPPATQAVFHADHPFLFAIRDNHTGSILFMGRVVDPT